MAADFQASGTFTFLGFRGNYWVPNGGADFGLHFQGWAGQAYYHGGGGPYNWPGAAHMFMFYGSNPTAPPPPNPSPK